MKKLFILGLLLIPVLLFADVDTKDGVAITEATDMDGFTGTIGDLDGGGAPTGGVSAACSSCEPGEPTDYFCEDTDAAGPAYRCAAEWTESIDGGNSITKQAHSGDINADQGCTDQGSYAIEFDIDGSNGELAALTSDWNDWGNRGEVNAKFYLRFTAWSTDHATQINIFGVEAAGSAAALIDLYLYNSSGTYYLRMFHNGTEGNENIQSAEISLNVWYEIEVYWIKDTAPTACWFKIDGSQTSCTNTSENMSTDEVNIGSSARSFNVGATDTATYELDIIKVDDDTMPGDCAQ